MKEITDMSDDNILLSDIVEEHDISVKQLATLTGYGVSTMYKFMSGSATIPSIVWRSLYKKTKDDRILKLITGDMPLIVVPMDISKTKDMPTLKGLISSCKASLVFEEHVLDIIADGKIDALDAGTIAKLRKTFPVMIAGLSQIYQAITKEFEEIE